ncbi:cyclin-dependent kinase inhibitor 1B-like [Brienomyrus brachyistius]|uniref:cyclin-dependent kinase inhibitor 1B-like n=1 Tax=Brienomyrus brachyistius TaxID=42636 RepID=UPI0020B17FD2|nr:cyclin-dependent kinase inhibitor 1B-like [Brienomyrus brachyistius]
MSNIQLSSTDRLVARRTFPLHARTSVCRNLFGPVDHDELNSEMKSKLRELSDRDKRRWNFNFETDTPLSGEYKWEEIPMNAMPVFYWESQTGKTGNTVPVKGKEFLDVIQNNCASLDVPHSPVVDRLCSSEVILPKPSEVNQENCPDKIGSEKNKYKAVSFKRTLSAIMETRATARMTDYYDIKRRMTDVKPNGHSSPHSAQAIPVELTPRKRIR